MVSTESVLMIALWPAKDKGARGIFPFLDIVSPGRGERKRVLGGVDGDGTDRFLVVGERDH